MEYTITNKHRQKMALATHSKGTIARVKMIALGTGGMDGRNVRVPVPTATRLNNEVLRREYTTAEKVDDFCYEYQLRLSGAELVGQAISELALIDEEGDLICVLNTRPKEKDDVPETYRIRNHYE